MSGLFKKGQTMEYLYGEAIDQIDKLTKERDDLIIENNELKEKIKNIQTEFFKDQSDGYAASNMLKISQSAKVLGGIKTDKKARSSAENGKKGGRPKKVV